ncbi:TolC family protein, partial [Maribacter sp.]|nr:TolC family protein [Maribacter sp.]
LYALFEKKNGRLKPFLNKNVTIILMLVGLAFTSQGAAQENSNNLEELMALAIENNAGIKAANLNVEQSDALIANAFDFKKTQLYYSYDQNNLSIGDVPLNVLGVQQDFLFPTVYFAKKKVNKVNYALSSSSYAIRVKALKREVTSAYYHYQYAKEKEEIYRRLDSLYQNFAHMAKRRFELGETNYLEKITAASKQRQLQIALEQAQQDVAIAYSNLLTKTQIPNGMKIQRTPLGKIPLSVVNIDETVELAFSKNTIALAIAKRKMETQQLLPDISLDYFQGTNSAFEGNLYGYQAGLKIPLLFGGNASRIKAAKIAQEIAVEESKEYEVRLKAHHTELLAQFEKYASALEYYEVEGDELSEELLKIAELSFKNGEINFFQYIQSIENANEIRLDRLENLNHYNQTVIQLNYLSL